MLSDESRDNRHAVRRPRSHVCSHYAWHVYTVTLDACTALTGGDRVAIPSTLVA